MHAIANADYHVKVVIIYIVGLCFALNCTMSSGCCIFCNYQFTVQFSRLSNINNIFQLSSTSEAAKPITQALLAWRYALCAGS